MDRADSGDRQAKVPIRNWANQMGAGLSGDVRLAVGKGCTIEKRFLPDGRPVRPEQIRWRHGCGETGPWDDRFRSKVGAARHCSQCEAGPIVAGCSYTIRCVADRYVVVQPGERVSIHSMADWLLSDRDDSEGRQRLVDFVRQAGGVLVA